MTSVPIRRITFSCFVALLSSQALLSVQVLASDPVTCREDRDTFTLSNGIITARVLKRNGDIRSMKYKGTELLTARSGHAGGYWSHDSTGGVGLKTSITIDPASNGGARAEVSIKGISGGRKMGHGPGAAQDGDFPADIEIRYTLGQGDSGIYTYCIFDHLPEYGAANMTEARFAVKLADFFDWISIDKYRNKHYPQTLPEEDKYVYTTVQSENRAFGFSSTKRKIGFYLVNPSVEYLSGGPTKPEFLCHRDTTRVQAPVILNYWRSSHYGGATVSVEKGESWTRVVGPFLLYVNEGKEPIDLWQDARAKAESESKLWPYDWVKAKGYCPPEKRVRVRGQLKLEDPLVKKYPGSLVVGLTKTPYSIRGWRGRPRTINWQTDAKHLQFWSHNNSPEGKFEINAVPPGKYTLHAFADGVLGEFAKSDIQVSEGTTVELGELTWKPVRRGEQLWEVGVANRTAKEFSGGTRFFEPDITLQYPKLFPEDVAFTIGKSKFEQDWFYAHIPHNTDPNAKVVPFRGVRGNGRPTPYRIQFELDESASKKLEESTANLRMAICGTGARLVTVSVNGQSAGRVLLRPDGVISRHQVQGLWYERDFEFAGSLLKPGKNTLTLTVPAGAVTAGVVYDYLRLELGPKSQ